MSRSAYSKALSKVRAGIRGRVVLYAIGHPQAVVAELAPTCIGGAVVSANESERIARLYGTDGAVLQITYEVFHSEFKRIRSDGQQLNGILVVMAQVVAARISAIVSENKFVPAQRIAPEALVTHRTLTYTTITRPLVQAQYIVALVFVTSCIANCS